MSDCVIEVKDLFMEYKDKNEKRLAVDHISFNVMKGEIFGLLGPNGAGKTTTIKILTTLLTATSGKIKVLNMDINSHYKYIRKKINFVFGGEKGVYPRLTGLEYLMYFCVLYKVPLNEQKKKAIDLLKLVGLEDEKTQIFNYSKGMIQRLHIARAMINNPEIIFLDEPTIGLDPIGARMLRDLVKELSKRGVTIILTTHYMPEADVLCDTVAFINNGSISIMGTPQKIKEEVALSYKVYKGIIELKGNPNFDNLNSNFYNFKIERLKENFSTIKFNVKNKDLTIEAIETILNEYCKVIKIESDELTLEDAYIHFMKSVGD